MKKHNGILVVPDIHLNIGLINRITNHLEKNEYNKVVFLGDYFDDWDASLLIYDRTVDRLMEIKEKIGDKAIFLLGNHEISYITRRPCSGYNFFATPIVQNFVRRVNPRIAYFDNKVLFTHAGVTEAWYDAFADGANWLQIATRINSLNIEADTVFGAGSARGGNSIPSPVWADKSELEADPLLIRQVVGHTPVKEITDNGNAIFCDTFSNGNEYDELLCITDNGLMNRVKI